MRKTGVLIAVLIFVFTANILFAQVTSAANNAPELRFGIRTNGILNQRSETWYTLNPSQNSFMVIEVSSDDFDSYIEVYDSNRELIGEDDDSGEGHNAKVEVYGLRGSSYLVKVRSYNKTDGGSFRIMASYKPAPHAVELRYGISRNGNLARRDEHWYSVRTTQAGLVIVETTGDDVDTYLDAYNHQYRIITSNDDGGVNKNARVQFIAEANQMYYFKLRAYDETGHGQYNIMATYEEIPADTGNTERSRAIALNIGDTRLFFFHHSDESRWFSFVVPRGGANVTVYTSGNLDTQFILYDGRGVKVAEDDNSGTDKNASVSQRLSAGTYYIAVKETEGNVGSFVLSID